MLWKIVAALGIIVLVFCNAIVGAVLLVVAVLLFMVSQKQTEKCDVDLARARAIKKAQAAKTAPDPTAMPADGSLPEQRPGETPAAWAARLQAAELAAFKARQQRS